MSAPSGSGGAGRRLGVDVGGTKCRAVVLDGDTVIGDRRQATPRGPGSALVLLDALAQLVIDMVDECGPVESVGIGVPGLVTDDGVLRAAPNLDGVANLEVRRRLESSLGRPVVVDNDATCATLAEWRLGAGRGTDDLLLVTLGTGIGGGIVSGGAVRRGANGFAGEFGHIPMDPRGPDCPCGRRGCWERYASGSGLVQLATGRTLGGVPVTSGEQVLAGVRSGDSVATALLDEFAMWVARGLAGLVNALDPAVVLIGGGLVADADRLIPLVEHHFRLAIYQPEHRPLPLLRAAQLGERAGAIGAALLGEGPKR